ncbi:MAG: ribosome silencing factor [Burkholderiaceae bacterium]
MTTEATAKRNTQKLQRVIVDGLEDVKAQDIQVFDTEHLSSLFERVVVASGTSNRHTKALAASVRDAVREAGFPKPRIEGEANGEWIIVDCAQAVVHIMQPTFRSYYHLEELWGEKPVRLKFGAAKPVSAAAAKPAAVKTASKAAGKKSAAGKKAGVDKAAVQPAAPRAAKPTKSAPKPTRSAPAPTKSAARPAASKARPAAAKSVAVKPATAKPASARIKTVVVAKPSGKSTPAAKRGATAVKRGGAPAKAPHSEGPRKPSSRKG